MIITVTAWFDISIRYAYVSANTDYTIWQPEVHALNEDWLSTPVQGSAAPDNPVFFLSEADIYQHMGQTTDADRQTNLIQANGILVEPTHYWLRSVGGNTNAVALVINNGTWGWGNANFSTADRAFRPTIWAHR